jgi:hypothetical protein
MNRNNKCTPAVFCCITVLILTVAGCYGGSRGIVRFNELDYPASMSPFLYGPNNEILAKDRELMVIKHFRLEVYYMAIFYSLVSPLHIRDVGKLINTEVENCGGDGVVDVKISANTGPTTYMHPLTLLPFWPSYTTVVVEGDIVKHEPSHLLNSPKTEAIDIGGDVLIMEPADQTATVRLKEQCHVIGKIDTLFAEDYYLPWVSSGRSWKAMRPVDRDDAEEKVTMQARVKIAAREQGANVAQIIYILFDQNEVKAKYIKSAPGEPLFTRGEGIGVALDIRYWSCPTKQSP